MIDVRADVAIVYSVKDHHENGGMTFEERVQSWRDRGYTTHFMSGIAWGEYQDYFTGMWDGKWHLDEGQVTQHGRYDLAWSHGTIHSPFHQLHPVHEGGGHQAGDRCWHRCDIPGGAGVLVTIRL